MPIQKKLLTAAVSLQLLKGESDAPPSEFCVFHKGAMRTSKGTFQFSDASALAVMTRAATYGNDFPIDYDHAMHAGISLDPAESGKASGWFKPELRDGELWATNVRWTPKASKMLTDREYRYFSPVFGITEDGEIDCLMSVALTNLPATYGQEPLMASQTAVEPAPQQKEQPPMKSLLAALGLSENATEAEGLAALHRLKNGETEMLTLTSQKTAQEGLGVLKAWKAQSEKVVALTSRVSELETEKAKVELDAVIIEAKKAGKVSPAMETELRKMELSQLKAFVSVLPAITPAAVKEQTNGQQAVVQLSQEEIHIAGVIGIPLEEVAKRKALRSGVVAIEAKK